MGAGDTGSAHAWVSSAQVRFLLALVPLWICLWLGCAPHGSPLSCPQRRTIGPWFPCLVGQLGDVVIRLPACSPLGSLALSQYHILKANTVTRCHTLTRAQTGVGYRWDFVSAGSTAPTQHQCTVCSLPCFAPLSWSGNLI